jgi:hypothetical protein
MGELIPIAGIVMGCLIPITALWTRHRKEIVQMQMQAAAEKAAQYAANNKELEERLRVLERIVTDKGYDVATQIEALRDQHRVEELLQDRTGAQRRMTTGVEANG